MAKKTMLDEKEEIGKSRSRCIYELFGVERDASFSEIRKAYHRLALQLHPDKNIGDEGAKEKFQQLQQIFVILSDPDKRAVYDQTGSLEDSELTEGNFNDLREYYRSVFKKVTEEDVAIVEEKYRGSSEEKRDLLGLYTRFRGNMNLVFAWLMCSRPEVDSHRFRDIVNESIEAGTVRSYKEYRKWAREVNKRSAPSDPLGQQKSSKRKEKSESSESLVALISGRQSDRRTSIIETLQAKYAQKANKRGKFCMNSSVEPSEEEFKAAQKRIAVKKSD